MKITQQRGRSHALKSLFPQQEPKLETKSLERLIHMTFRKGILLLPMMMMMMMMMMMTQIQMQNL
jgi:hypothetical protein